MISHEMEKFRQTLFITQANIIYLVLVYYSRLRGPYKPNVIKNGITLELLLFTSVTDSLTYYLRSRARD